MDAPSLAWRVTISAIGTLMPSGGGCPYYKLRPRHSYHPCLENTVRQIKSKLFHMYATYLSSQRLSIRCLFKSPERLANNGFRGFADIENLGERTPARFSHGQSSRRIVENTTNGVEEAPWIAGFHGYPERPLGYEFPVVGCLFDRCYHR